MNTICPNLNCKVEAVSNMKKVKIDLKKALFLDDKQITDYIYTAAFETEKEVVLCNPSQMGIYSKITGEKLYEYERNIIKSSVWGSFHKNCIMVDSGDKYFLVKSDGTKVSDKEFDNCETIRLDIGEFFIVTIDGKKGMYNLDVEEIIPVIYDDISIKERHLDFAFISKNGKHGIHDLKGNIIIPPLYDDLFIRGNFIIACDYEKNVQYVYSRDGKTLVYTDYNEAEIRTNKLGIMIDDSKNKTFSLYSHDGTPILENYETIIVHDSPTEGVVVAKKNGMYGLYDYSGKELLPCIYKLIMSIGSTTKPSSGVLGVFDLAGQNALYSISEQKIVLPFDCYLEVVSYKDKICEIVREGGIHGFYFCEYDKFVMADNVNITKTGRFEFLNNGKWTMRKYIM